MKDKLGYIVKWMEYALFHPIPMHIKLEDMMISLREVKHRVK